MNRRQSQSARAAALQLSLSIIALCLATILFTTSFTAAPKPIVAEPTATPPPGPLTVSLPVYNLNPVIPIDALIFLPVTTANIVPSLGYIGFQGDFTFDETVCTFSSPFVQAAGLTENGWTVAGNILDGPGPIRTLRVSAFVNDGMTPLAGFGTLYHLIFRRVSNTPPANTLLAWGADPDNFVFIDSNLNTITPLQTNGVITVCNPGDMCPTPTPTPAIACGSFSNSTTITIPAAGTSGIASPYPSNITVSGLGGAITKVTVAINGIIHSSPSDIDLLLVGPTGKNAIIMSDVGGATAVNGVNLVLDDTAAASLPIPPFAGPLISGTFRPTNNQECYDLTAGIDTFPAPAPTPSGASPLSFFNGTNPNGTWSLYVVDDYSGGGTGSISGGWSITISTDSCAGPTATPRPSPTPGGATHFAVDILANNFGQINFRVTARDALNNTVTSYPGTVHFTSSGAQVPSDSGLTNGTGTFSATEIPVYLATITATDTNDPSITGTSVCTIAPKPGSPSPTVPPPPSPSPTPLPTGTPIPTPCGVTFSENFDGVPVPSLPIGWTTAASGAGTWFTAAVGASSQPNAAMAYESSNSGETVLETPAIEVPAAGGVLSFQNHFNLLGNSGPPPGGQGWNGMVLDIRINDGFYDDIVTAGGVFLDGGYTHTIGCCFSNPLTGRRAWSGLSGNSASSITTTIALPPSANGQSIKLKWHVGTMEFPIGGIPPSGEVRIDSIVITAANCPTPTPCPACTPTPTPTATATPSPTATPTNTPPPGHILLVNRLSDARAYARTNNGEDNPPPQTQTDFLPANLSNSASSTPPPTGTPIGGGFAAANSTSNSVIDVDQALGTLRVTGNGHADVGAATQNANAEAGAKLIVIAFAVDAPFYYSLTGDLSSLGCFSDACGMATAKLTEGSSTLFEVSAPPNATLSQTGTLPPGTYTLSVEVIATVGSPFSQSGTSVDASFTFALDPAPTPTPTPTATPGETPSVNHALNLSTRLRVGTGSDVGIGGFIISGAPAQVLVRGLGPSLGNIGIPNALVDPILELHGTGDFVTIVDNNWRDTQEKAIIATGIAPTNDLESAILAADTTLPSALDPGAYTVILKGNNPGTGVGLVEIYDLSNGSNAKLANISTRGTVGTGSEIVIAGFILGGGSNDDVILLRGIGPSLSQSGVPNALSNPILELRNSDGVMLATNDDWQSGPAVSLPPNDPLESAIEMPLSPGAYTALLSGVNNGTGVGLVEVYDLGAEARRAGGD